jgi:hypothetical protein
MTITTSNQASYEKVHQALDLEQDENLQDDVVNNLPNSTDTMESMKTSVEPAPLPAPQKGVFRRFSDYFLSFFGRSNNEIVVTVPNNIALKTESRKWLEQQFAELSSMLESNDINIETFIEKLATLASISFCLTSQIETDERNELYRQLHKELKAQQGLYGSWRVFGADALTGVVSAYAGFIGINTTNVNFLPSMDLISKGMQSGSKLMGNHIEAQKVSTQHIIERIKQMIEISRNRTATHERQASEVEARITQAKQLMQSIVDKLTQ